ncbi:hypothetical protein RR46_03535 [Papilio xuthus]|uniref:Uncharacterized protein n=1 Tax=Papilio xuthus TaxID=66420 RepID=A0A194QDH3_PAPXU|nr:hypothetical protein RR46_03535 [Papilio xuthus]
MGEEMTKLVRAMYQIFQKKSTQDKIQDLNLNLGDLQVQTINHAVKQDQNQDEGMLNKFKDMASDSKIYSIHESQHGYGDEVLNNIHSL